MFNPLSFFSKFIKTGNQKELDRIAKIVEKINVLEGNFKNLADIDFHSLLIKYHIYIV